MKKDKLLQLKDQIVEAYNSGSVIRQLATAHGVSPRTMSLFLSSQGVTLRTRGRRKKEITNGVQ